MLLDLLHVSMLSVNTHTHTQRKVYINTNKPNMLMYKLHLLITAHSVHASSARMHRNADLHHTKIGIYNLSETRINNIKNSK